MIFPLSPRERGNEGERLLKLNKILKLTAMPQPPKWGAKKKIGFAKYQ
jgi:hypothetical protein